MMDTVMLSVLNCCKKTESIDIKICLQQQPLATCHPVSAISGAGKNYYILLYIIAFYSYRENIEKGNWQKRIH